jgi:hypothetical protein
VLKSLTTSSTLKASADDPTVITLAVSLTLTIIRAQKSEESSIVCTIAVGIVHTIIHNSQTDQLSGQSLNFLSGQKNTIPKGLNSYNFGATDFDYTIGSKHQKRAQLSRQKLSASPPQIYNAQAACLWPQPFSQENCHYHKSAGLE